MSIRIIPEFCSSKYCILSPESMKTLQLFKIELALSKLQLVNEEMNLYKLDESHKPYYNWGLHYEEDGYDHIISEICSSKNPFYKIDQCCYGCREGFGCEERKRYVYLWIWKPVLESDKR
jgi:hypothetical protein